jgi:pyrroline-5-carboxylate reductase
MHKEQATGFIGGGNMAEAIIKGLLAGGVPAGKLSE